MMEKHEPTNAGGPAPVEQVAKDVAPEKPLSMYSKIIQASNDMKKSIIANFRV